MPIRWHSDSDSAGWSPHPGPDTMADMSTERVAVYPGSFDPVTRGHLDVLARVRGLFDRVHVAVIENPSKTPLFSAAERVEMLRAETSALENVEVRSFDGLTVALVKSLGGRWIIRGVRSSADLDYELPMAHSNRVCGGETIETLFVPAAPEVAFIASRLVREIAAGGGELAPFVTPRVGNMLRSRYGG